MRCARAERWIVSTLAGGLSESRRRRLEEHLEACASCRAEAREAGFLWEELSRTEAPEPGPAYWRSFASRVRRRIEAAASGDPAQLPGATWRTQELWCRALAAAAIVLVLALGALDRFQQPPTTEADDVLEEILRTPELADRVIPAALSVEDPMANLYEEFSSLSPEDVERLWIWLEQEIDRSDLLQRRSDDEVS